MIEFPGKLEEYIFMANIGEQERIGYFYDSADDGELPTPSALGKLLVDSLRRGRSNIAYLSREGAEEIQGQGIDVDKATQAVTNITGTLVVIKKH